MKVSELIKILQAMPQDAEVVALQEHGTGLPVELCWLSRGGEVFVGMSDCRCYQDSDRPSLAPTKAHDESWNTPWNQAEMEALAGDNRDPADSPRDGYVSVSFPRGHHYTALAEAGPHNECQMCDDPQQATDVAREILSAITEWRKGCSDAPEASPSDCAFCTKALIESLEKKAMRLID